MSGGPRLRVGVACVAVLLAGTISGYARNCSFSKEFRLQHPQVLSGALEDPAGLPLPGIELYLLSGKDIVQRLRTDNRGAYKFLEVPSGKYRIRVKTPSDTFCAPKVQCGTQGCVVRTRLRLNPKSLVTVY
jgi:hypothetical protein